jgi:protein CpxP
MVILHAIRRAAPLVAMAALLGASALGAAELRSQKAIDNPALLPVQGQRGAPGPGPGGPPPPGGPPGGGAEMMINQLRQAIRPTPAQEPQFSALAEVMRNNERAMASMPQPSPQASGVDELRMELQIGESELDGMRKLLPPLEALYATLSPPQRQAADNIFHQAAGPPR